MKCADDIHAAQIECSYNNRLCVYSCAVLRQLLKMVKFCVHCLPVCVGYSLCLTLCGKWLLSLIWKKQKEKYYCCLYIGCVSTSASDWLERLVSEMTYNVLMGTLNPTSSLTYILVVFLAVHKSAVDCMHWQATSHCGEDSASSTGTSTSLCSFTLCINV